MYLIWDFVLHHRVARRLCRPPFLSARSNIETFAGLLSCLPEATLRPYRRPSSTTQGWFSWKSVWRRRGDVGEGKMWAGSVSLVPFANGWNWCEWTDDRMWSASSLMIWNDSSLEGAVWFDDQSNACTPPLLSSLLVQSNKTIPLAEHTALTVRDHQQAIFAYNTGWLLHCHEFFSNDEQRLDRSAFFLGVMGVTVSSDYLLLSNPKMGRFEEKKRWDLQKPYRFCSGWKD